MKIYDISLTITPELPVWPGDPKVVLERIYKIEEGANANVSRMDLGVHTGTHVDAPHHFVHGAKTIEQLDLEVLIGPVQVVALPDTVTTITAAVLEQAGLHPPCQRVLFKTRNSAYWTQPVQRFQTDFVGIDAGGARWLVEHGLRLVGIDYLSIAPFKKSRPTHEALLEAEMIVLEGVNLSAVPAGDYTLYCLPLKLGGSDGAPARAILTA